MMKAKVAFVASYLVIIVGVILILSGIFFLAVTFFLSLTGWGLLIVGVLVAFSGNRLREKALDRLAREKMKTETK